MSDSKKRWLLALVGVGALAAVSGSPAAHGESAEGADQKAAAVEEDGRSAHVAVGNLRIAVDPETGELRPLTRAEARALTREMKRLFPDREMELRERPDGSLSAVAAPNVVSYSVARVGSDGELMVECAAGRDAALDFLTSEAPAQPAQREER